MIQGIQQGDPLGPLLFCLSIHHLLLALHSELRMSYLDDISLGGDVEDISNDLVMFKQGAKDVGLQLNPNKCEIISVVPDSQNSILSLIPGSRIVNLSMATLLGSPLGDVPGISSVLTAKTNLLKIMGERLPLLSTHDAYLLLRHSIALPKLLYCLRTAPCFLSPQLQQYDAVLKTIMCTPSISTSPMIILRGLKLFFR